MVTARFLLAFTMVSLASFLPVGGAIRAGEPSDAAVERADEFLGTKAIGTYVLSYAQPGAKYASHSFRCTRPVVDEDRQLVPGKFAMVYQYRWETDGAGTTELGFICNRHGGIEEVVVVEPDVIRQQPFLGSEVTIQRLGHELVDPFKPDLSPNDLRLADELVGEVDYRGLLGFGLKIKQALSW